MNARNTNAAITLAILSTLGLSACNIDLSIDPNTLDSVNKTSTGVITALNQLQVNDVNYDTSEASIVADGNEVDESGLRLGMVVSVTGIENSDGSGKAMYVEYQDVAEGAVTSNNMAVDNTLLIMGQTVHVDDKTVFESSSPSITSIGEIESGNIVEVSGYTAGDGIVWATRIEIKNESFVEGNKIEVKGKVSSLTETSFSLGELMVSYSGVALENGDYIEVTSRQGFDESGALIAESIKIKGKNGKLDVNHASNDEEVELKGRVTAISDDTTIEVNGSVIFIGGANNYDSVIASLSVGDIVEVEGYIDAQGNFQTKQLELENDLHNGLDVDSDNDADSSAESIDNDDDDDSNKVKSDDEGEEENDD